MPDIAEMHRILEIIQDESKQPEGTTWNQGYWFRQQEVGNTCGTALCFAGWKIYLDGYTKLIRGTEFGLAVQDYSGARMFNPETNRYVTYWGAQDYAMKALGLTEDQADLLFDEGNDLEDLENIVNDIEAESRVDVLLGFKS